MAQPQNWIFMRVFFSHSIVAHKSNLFLCWSIFDDFCGFLGLYIKFIDFFVCCQLTRKNCLIFLWNIAEGDLTAQCNASWIWTSMETSLFEKNLAKFNIFHSQRKKSKEQSNVVVDNHRKRHKRCVKKSQLDYWMWYEHNCDFVIFTISWAHHMRFND